MGNRETPTRSFNTVKHSNRKERLQRLQRGRITLLSICTVILILLLIFAVFIFCSLADELNAKKDTNGNGTENDAADNTMPQGVVYIQSTQKNTKIHEGELIVVNGDHAYNFSANSTELINIYENRTKVNGTNPYQISYSTYQLQKSAFDAFENMLLKYYSISEDNAIIITSSYRSYADQEDLGSSIAPGYSDHHTGFSVALQKTSAASGNREKLEADHWIYQNCHKYGYIVRYPNTKTVETGVSDYAYCFRYVGIPHATYITEKAICLEEYVDLLKNNYAGNEHLKITGADGNAYEVYYVAASSGELTTLNIPSNYEYTISGDNIGGFIVTVNLNAPIA